MRTCSKRVPMARSTFFFALCFSVFSLLQSLLSGSLRADDGSGNGGGNSSTGQITTNAGRDKHVAVGATVEVDGSASLSPAGSPLSYSWVIESKPAGSHAALSSSSAIRPTVTIDTAGDYVLALTLRAAGGHGDDGSNVTSVSRVTLSTVNVRPVANAGLNRIAAVGATVALDGAGSFDADGNVIGYSWSLVQVPRASKAALSARAAVRPTLTLDQPGTYVAELTVTDATGAVSAPSRVAVSTRAAVAGSPSAGPAQSLNLGATARIDADGTYAAGGPPQTASWSLIGVPAGSRAALAIAADAREALTPDLAGDYVVQMSIGGASDCRDEDEFDDRHYRSQRLARFATVLVSTRPVAPIAHVGPDQRVTAGASVTLDAARSTDVTGPLLTYTWALISKPAGSAASLSDPVTVRPTFTADLAGAFVAQLIVSDGVRQSAPATVVVAADTATPLAPSADGGPDPRAVTGTTVALDGRGSFNPDGTPLSAQWLILGLGDQLTGSLTSPTTLQTGFGVPTAGVPLTQAILTGPAAIAISGDDHGGDDGSVNLSLAAAGRLTAGAKPYTVWRVRNASSTGQSATVASADLTFTLGISIPARSDLFIASTATTGSAPHKLSVAGKLVATVNATSTSFGDTRLVGGGPALRLSVVELIAANALLQSPDDVVISTVEARPLAVPRAPATALRGTAQALDGLGSKNPNSPATPTSGLTYRWALLARPAASTAALANATSVQASLTPDVYGLYVAQLIVSDGVLDSRPQTVAILVTARPPVASVTAPSPVGIGRLVTLDGSASLDPDGNALSYAWTLTGVAAGSHAALSNATAAKATFTPDLAGAYSAQLIVRDAYGASAPVSVTVIAQAQGLVFDTLGSQSVALGSTVAFTVHATDPAGKPVSYTVAGSLPASATFNAATGVVTFHPTSNVPAAVTLAFTASNGTDSTTLSVPITITGSPNGTTAGLSALVFDAVDFAAGKRTPVSGAVVSVGGITATSSATGAVTLSGLAAGIDTLTVSAATAALAPDGTHYNDTVTSATLIAGVTNALDAPILLGRGGVGTAINPGGPTLVTNPTLGVTLTIAANSALNPNGTPYTGTVTLGSLPASTPVNLPQGFSPCQLLTVSPAGITFNPPAQLSVANADHLPAGTTVDLWAFDLALGSARVTGSGVVSTDGATIALTVGGVPGGTVFAIAPRRPGAHVSTAQPADIFTPSMLGSGNMQASFSPPGTRQLDTARGLTFVYNSATANPSPVLRESVLMGANTGLPQTLATSLTVGGVTQSSSLTTNLSTPQSGGTALNGALTNALVQAGAANLAALPTGSYPYSFLTVAKYGCSAVAFQSFGTLVVNNQSSSAFGPGWQLAEVQKLTPQPDGSVAIAEGSGNVVVMHPQQNPDFLPNPVFIPINGPFRGALADLQNTGRRDIVRLGWKDGSLNVILNKGNRQFVKGPSFNVGAAGTQNPDGSLSVDISDVALGDINGDGNQDAAVISSRAAITKVYYGATGGTFVPYAATIGQNDIGGDITMGDWIGTGRTHLMISEGTGAEEDFHIIYNDGAGHLDFNFGQPSIPGHAVGATAVRLPGFAHDSFVGITADASVLFAYGGSVAATHTLFSRGVGTEPPNPQPNARISFNDLINDGSQNDVLKLPGPVRPIDQGRIVSAGDIDGSGTPAIAVAGLGGIYIVKWFATGANNQQVVQTLSLPAGLSPDSVTLAPLASGNRASVIAMAGTAGFYVFPNDGKGNFGAAVFIATPFRVGIDINVADLDGDGIADVVLNDLDNDRVAIYFGHANAGAVFVAPIGDYTRLVQNPDGTYSRLYNDGTKVDFTAAGLQTTITDANGNRTSYTYNGAGQLIAIVDPTGATTTMTYAGPYIATLTDGAGRTTSFQHDAAGNTISITDPAGNTTQYLYDARSQLIATIDPKGAKTTSTFTATGQLKSQSYPDGTSVKLDVSKALGLDALGVDLGGPTNAAFVQVADRVSFLQDQKGNLTETEVNEWGAVIRAVDPLGRTSTFLRDAANRVIESTLPAGVSTGAIAPTPTGTPQNGSSDTLVNEYQWDANGNLLVLEEGAGHAPHPGTLSFIDRTTQWAYEPTHNRVIKKTDPAGFVTSYAFDASGNQTSMTDALGNVSAATYDARGLLLSSTGPRGFGATFVYDANGYRTRTTDATGTNLDQFFDASGNPILTIAAAGTPIERRRSAQFDANNRKVQETSATGELTTTVYDSNGNASVLTDPAGNVTTRTFDTLNRLHFETTPDSGTVAWTYDASGNLATLTDAAGTVTANTYDAVNRRLTSTDATGAVRTLAYDVRNNFAAYTDPRGNTNAFEYDALRRLNVRTLPGAGGIFATQYDVRDNAIFVAPPDRIHTGAQALTYDALSRLTSDGPRTRTYDAAGNVLTINGESNSTLTYTFDPLNRVASTSFTEANSSGDYATPVTLSYTHDALSRRTAMADTLGATTGYTYDAEDRLASITTPWGGVITQTYDAAGRPSRLALPNGLDADLAFETGTGRIASLTHRAGSQATPIAQFTNMYDVRGNLASLAELTATKTYSYDALERLTAVAQSQGGGAAAPAEGYAYDGEGNRTSAQTGAASALAVTTDAQNRVTDDGVNSYTWTPNNALSSRAPKAAGGSATTFSTSWQGGYHQVRLDSANTPTGLTQFFYDPLNRLVGYRPNLNGGALDDRYYDGADMVLQFRRPSSGAQWVRYVSGPGADRPLGFEIYPAGAAPTPGTGQVFYYHADAEGSIRLVTDANAQIANRYDYDSFGKRLNVVEAVAQPYTWKGREWIDATGLYYNRARFYDPQLGRFTSEDPLGYAASGANLYAFASNNPHHWRDPTGYGAIDYSGTILIGLNATQEAINVGIQINCTLGTLAVALNLINQGNAITAIDTHRGVCSVNGKKTTISVIDNIQDRLNSTVLKNVIIDISRILLRIQVIESITSVASWVVDQGIQFVIAHDITYVPVYTDPTQVLEYRR